MAVSNELTTYIALFHHRDNAASAIRELAKAGFTPDSLTVIGGGNGTTYSDATGSFGEGYGYASQDGLTEVGVPEGDRKHLEEGLAKGGTILALQGSGARAEEIEEIFHQHSTNKIDETDVNRASFVDPIAVASEPITDTAAGVIPVVEEDLVVGKREVERGGVRVFSRIVEQPVTETVSLREEHVTIDRRPVDRAVTQMDLIGGDQTIELKETAEEAVIAKTARVVEEVHLGKEATDRTETIHDTVRHTEIDVEQLDAADTTTTSKKY